MKIMADKFTLNIPQSLNTQSLDMGRLTFLIDGVIAVSMTLLVLDLKLPEGNGNLANALRQMLPGLLVYLIIFSSVAGY